jgi:hypothetical protein
MQLVNTFHSIHRGNQTGLKIKGVNVGRGGVQEDEGGVSHEWPGANADDDDNYWIIPKF